MILRLSLLSILFLCSLGIKAQVTTTPSPLQEDATDVMVYFHADQGDRGLMGQPASAKIFAHTGVITNLSGNNWKNAPTWGDDSEKFRLSYVSENLWQLKIGNMREYYGITNPDEQILKLAFVFRTAGSNPSATGRAEGGGDIFVDVVDKGLQLILTSSAPGNILTPETAYVTFTAVTTQNADISLTVNKDTVASQANSKELVSRYLFEKSGNYTVTASATANGDTVSQSLQYLVLDGSKKADYPGGKPKMGPVANADSSVTFCLGAPAKSHVVLMGEWNGYANDSNQVMSYQDVTDAATGQVARYFWTTVKGLDPEKMYGYYFIVDGTYNVGDPYARLVLDPWNDEWLDLSDFNGLPSYPWNKVSTVPLAVYYGNINKYDWQVKDFKGVDQNNLIIYEMLFRDFTGTEGKADGNGTVKKAIEKIPYLVDLGVNAVEVLPIMEFNGNISWGYNPNFYFAPDKAYGTPDDYKEFIDKCHSNGIAVILDMVFNQSDGLHPWYQMYPTGQNPFYNQDAPHAYSVLNDWNQGTVMLQEQWHDVLEYWLTEYKFDGFRFDLVKGLGNNESYPNNGDAATNQYNQSRIDRMIELQKIVKSINSNAYFINEDLAYAAEENAMAAYGQLNWANVNSAACQFAKGTSSNSNLNPLYAPNNDNRTWGSTVSYLESHDEQRLAYAQNNEGVSGVKGNSAVSMQRLGAAAAQMILTPGAHMIWQFSEMGNAQNTKNNNGGNNTDPKIVNWSLLDDPNHYGLYESYCSLIHLRNKNPELFAKDGATFTMACNQGNWSTGRWLYSKTTDGKKELYTIINPGITGQITVTNVPFSSPDNSKYYIASKSYNSNPTFNATIGTVTVPANCYVTIANTATTAIDDVEQDGGAALQAHAAGGLLSVTRAPGKVTVYNLDGAIIGILLEGESLYVQPGVYILHCGYDSIKVAAN